MTRGRPKKYNPRYCNELVSKMETGHFDYEIAADWNVSRDTFYSWIKEYPEFKEAYDRGYVKCFKWWMTEGRKRFAESNDKGFKYWDSVMGNKFGMSAKAGSQNTTNTININNVNILKNKSQTELLEFIQSKLIEEEIIDLDETQYKLNEPGKEE